VFIKPLRDELISAQCWNSLSNKKMSFFNGETKIRVEDVSGKDGLYKLMTSISKTLVETIESNKLMLTLIEVGFSLLL